MPELKAGLGSRGGLVGAGALAVLALAGASHWFALAEARDAGGELVQRYVDVNMDDMPFGAGVCPARDPGAISGFIDDTRDELKGALIPAWWSSLDAIELRIERIDDVAGRKTGSSGSGLRHADGIVSVAKAGRDIAIAYSVSVQPNGIAQGALGLLFVASAMLLWRRIPAGLTDAQTLWFRALVDAGEPRKAAVARAETLPDHDRWAAERRAAFDELVARRMYPPLAALTTVWSASANALQGDGWTWATRLLSQDESGAAEVFRAVSEAGPSAAPGPRQAFERLVSLPIGAAPLVAFRLVFSMDAQTLDVDGWEWVDFALENAVPSESKGGTPPDLSSLWDSALRAAGSPVTVELNMRADPPYLAVKGIRLKGFEQRSALIYYGQYLWRRLTGDGWLQNPEVKPKHPELQAELLKLFDRWDAPEAMKPVLDEGKHLADRLNNGRGLIKKAFGMAFGGRQALLAAFQFEEEPRGRVTAYRVKLDPGHIVIREVDRA